MKKGDLVRVIYPEWPDESPIGIVVEVNEETVPPILSVKVLEDGHWSEMYTTCDDVERLNVRDK